MDKYIGKDEKFLKILLDKSTDFEERRKIRAAIRDVRNKRFRTVTVYETPAAAASGSLFIHQQPPSVEAAATCPPPDAVLQAPVMERVRIVRKAQSFKNDREVMHADNGINSGINSKFAARNFLSNQLSFMAADNVNSIPIGVKPVERSQSFKLLASKFENNSVHSNGELNSKNKHDNQFKSASAVVETDQVVSSMKVGRTHSLKLPSYRDNSPSRAAPIGSLAHSYNEKRLLSGSDSDLSRSSRFASKERDSLIGNGKIRPFLKYDGTSQSMDSNNTEITNQTDLENSSKPNKSFRHSAPVFTDVKDVRRSSSLKTTTTPFFDGQEIKLRRVGSLRGSSYTPHDQFSSSCNEEYKAVDRSEQVISDPIDKLSLLSLPKDLDNSLNSVDSKNSITSVDSKSKDYYTAESDINSSWEERSAQKRVARVSTSNPFDDIEDEDQLNVLLKNATDLDERINIRAALHKLRQNHLAKKTSPPRTAETAKNNYTTKLEQNKAAINSLIQSAVPVTSEQSIEGSSVNTSMTSNHNNEDDDDVFGGGGGGGTHATRKRTMSDIPTEYFSIQNEDELQNLLNQTTDYFERKKIRTALTTLKRRHSLAEVEKVKGKHLPKSKSLQNNNHIDYHDNVLDNHINNSVLDTGQHQQDHDNNTHMITEPEKLHVDTENKQFQEANRNDRLDNNQSAELVSKVNRGVQDFSDKNTRKGSDYSSTAVDKQSTVISKQQQGGGSEKLYQNEQGYDSHIKPVNKQSSRSNSSTGGDIKQSGGNNRVKRRLPQIPVSNGVIDSTSNSKQNSVITLDNYKSTYKMNDFNGEDKSTMESNGNIINAQIGSVSEGNHNKLIDVDAHNGNLTTDNGDLSSSYSYGGGVDTGDTYKSSAELCSKDCSTTTATTVTQLSSLSSGLQTSATELLDNGATQDQSGSVVDVDVDQKHGNAEVETTNNIVQQCQVPKNTDALALQIQKETGDNSEQPLKTLDELRDELDELEKQLRNSCDFDERKQLRSEIRQVRMLIRDGDFILRTPRYVQPEIKTPKCVSETNFIGKDANQNHISAVEKIVAQEISTESSVNIVRDSIVQSKSDIIDPSQQSITHTCHINNDDQQSVIIKKDICDSLNNQKLKSKSGNVAISNNATQSGNNSKSRPGLTKQSNLTGDDAFKTFKHKLHAKKTERLSSDSNVIVDIVGTTEDKKNVNDDLNKTMRSSQDIYACEEGGEIVDVAVDIKNGQNEGSMPLKEDIVGLESDVNNKPKSETSLEDDIPEITTPLADIIAIDGESSSLSCTISAPLKAEITWYKETRILKDTPEFKQVRDQDVLTLTIPEVFPDDEGEYRCVAKANGGEAETSCYLLVKENKLAILPSFLTPLKDITVEDGGQVTLKCEISAKPTPRIYWYHGVELLKNHSEVKQEFTGGWATLTIQEVFAEDAGAYVCAAKNVAGESRCTCKLTVSDKTLSPYTPPPEEEPPTVTMDTEYFDLNEGDCLSLVCQITGSPSPCIIWKKDEKTLEASDNCHIDSSDGQASLVIYKLESSHDGVYECIVKNNAGNASVTSVVTVTAKPKTTSSQAGRLHITKLTRSQHVSKASELRNKHRSSSSSSNKGDEISEYKNRNLSSSSMKESDVFTGKDDKKTENKSHKSKTIVHKDSVGSSTKITSEPLTIEKSKFASSIDPPRILQPLPDHLEIQLEQHFCLECRFNFLNQKSTVAWFKDGIELPKVGRIKWSVEKAYTKLWINRASKGDVGNYRVLIKNGGGEAGSRCQIKLKSVVAPVRAKLEPKQVNEKASNLLHSVLGHMVNSNDNQPSESNVRREDHTKHLVNLIKSHRDPSSKITTNQHITVHLDKPDHLTRNEDAPYELETLHEGKELIMSSSQNVDSIDDEDLLYDMMSKTDNFDERKKIRGRLREIREKKSDEYDKKRQEREQNREDATQMKIRQAEADKQRRLKEFDKMARQPKKESSTMEDRIREKHAAADLEKQKKLEEFKEMGKVMSKSYHSGSDQITLDHLKKAEDDKVNKLQEFKEDAVSRSTRTEVLPGGSMTTTTSKTTHTTKDGSTVVTKETKQITQTGSIGGTSYTISKTSAEDAAKRLCDTFSNKALEGTSGILTVKTEGWSSKDGITHRNEKTKTWGAKQGPRGAMAAFKSMDNTNNPARPNRRNIRSTGSSSNSAPSTPTTPVSPGMPLDDEDGVGGGRVGVQRSPSAIKDMLLQWIQRQVNEYPNVNVTNFSSSWNDGMAFCALIHHFHPETFDFSKLDPKRRRANFRLAFDVAEKVADIAPLLEVDDMVRMKNPDWKCVFTYVQSFYRKFRDHDTNKA